MPSSPRSVAPRSRDRSRSISRRVGCAIAVLVNLVLIGLLNGGPWWHAVPFLTDETSQVILPLTLSLCVSALTHLADLLLDGTWVRAMGEIVTSAIAVIVILRIWEVFPFAFSDPDVPWNLIVRVVLGFAVAGCLLSIIVQIVVLARLVLGRTPSGSR